MKASARSAQAWAVLAQAARSHKTSPTANWPEPLALLPEGWVHGLNPSRPALRPV